MKDVTAPGSEARYPVRRAPPPVPRLQPSDAKSSALFSPPAASLADSRKDSQRPALQPTPAPTPAVQAPTPARITPRHTEVPRRPAGQAEVEKTAPRSPQRNRGPLVFTHREQVESEPLPATIRVHGETAGKAPFQVALSVTMPDHLQAGATILWTDNDRPIRAMTGFEAQMTLKEPGQHQIAAHILSGDDRKTVLRQTLTVLAPTTRPGA